jgi:hypothetical protein
MSSIPWTEVLLTFCLALELGALTFFIPFRGPFPNRNREHILDWKGEIQFSMVTNFILFLAVLCICVIIVWNKSEYIGTCLQFVAFSSLRFAICMYAHSRAQKKLAKLLVRFPQKETTDFTRGPVRVC